MEKNIRFNILFGIFWLIRLMRGASCMVTAFMLTLRKDISGAWNRYLSHYLRNFILQSFAFTSCIHHQNKDYLCRQAKNTSMCVNTSTRNLLQKANSKPCQKQRHKPAQLRKPRHCRHFWIKSAIFSKARWCDLSWKNGNSKASWKPGCWGVGSRGSMTNPSYPPMEDQAILGVAQKLWNH